MKRWIPIGVVLVLLILAFGLCATAWNPGEFSGDWYCAETGELFRFQDGLVRRRGCGGRAGKVLRGAAGRSLSLNFSCGTIFQKAAEKFLLNLQPNAIFCV